MGSLVKIITPCDLLLRHGSVYKLISISLVSRCQGARQQTLIPDAPRQVRWHGAQLKPRGHREKPRTRPGREAMLAGRTLPGMAWPWCGVGWNRGLRLKQPPSKQGGPKATPRVPHPHNSFQVILLQPHSCPQQVWLGTATRVPRAGGTRPQSPGRETTSIALSYSFSGYISSNKIFFAACVCWIHYLLFFKRLPPKPLCASLSRMSNDMASLREWWRQYLTCHHGARVSALLTCLLRFAVNEKQLTSDGRSLPPGWTKKIWKDLLEKLLLLMSYSVLIKDIYCLGWLSVKCNTLQKSDIKRWLGNPGTRITSDNDLPKVADSFSMSIKCIA